jgi:hypothetical protein
MRPAATRLAAAGALGLCLAVAGLAAGGTPGAGSAPVFRAVDRGLCPFPLAVTVATTPRTDQAATTVLQFAMVGPATVALRDVETGKTAVLRSSGDYTVDTRTGGVAFSGRQVWFWSSGGRVPFLTTDGPGRFVAPYDTLAGSPQAQAAGAGSYASTSTAGARRTRARSCSRTARRSRSSSAGPARFGPSRRATAAAGPGWAAAAAARARACPRRVARDQWTETV